MATNTLLTPDMITREALRILHQSANFVSNVVRDYDSSFAQAGAKIGDTLRVRLPNNYTVRSGATLSVNNTVERSVSLPLTSQHGVDIEYTTAELTFDIDDFAERILRPAMTVLAAKIESTMLTNVIKDIGAHIVDDGNDIAFVDVLNARAELVKRLMPMDGNTSMLLTPRSNAILVNELKGLFNPQQEISSQMADGFIGRVAGANFYENTHLARFTSGTAATSTGYQTNGALDTTADTGETSTITIDTGTTTFLQGDIISIANVNRVHPETKTDSGESMYFAVTADSGASATSLTIKPAIVATSVGNQNVTITTGDGDNAALTGVLGNAAAVDQDLMFHRDAFVIGTADGLLPDGVDMASRQVMDGISMRLVRQFDITNDDFPARTDVYWGYRTLRPELACRVLTN